MQDLRPGAGDKMPGVMCTIDAIGFEAKAHGSGSTTNTADQDPNEPLANLVRVTNPTGHIGLIGVYFPQDPGENADQKGNSPSPWATRGTRESASKWVRRR